MNDVMKKTKYFNEDHHASPKKLTFFDCNTYIGMPVDHRVSIEPVTAKHLLSEMDRAGIIKALVWHIFQYDGYALKGNELINNAIKQYKDKLIPCWTILPDHTDELGEIGNWFEHAKNAYVKAIRFFPKKGNYLLRSEVIGEIIEKIILYNIPIIYSLSRTGSWEELYDLLKDFPDLTIILTDMSCWGQDRYFRPLIEKYPNIYLSIGSYFLAGGIESFVKSYGSNRMVFGSGFPENYHGGMMLALAHAEIEFKHKQAIAADNLEKLLKKVNYD